MNKLIYLLAFGIMIISCGKDEPGSNQAEEFTKFYDGSFSDEGISVKSIPGGGYYLLGTFSESLNNKNIRLIRTDQYGNKVWEITLGDTLNDFAKDMILNTENDVFICGTYSVVQNNTEAFIAKINQNGNLLFQKKYGGNYNQEASCLALHPDGNIMIAGSTDADIYGNQIPNKIKDIFAITINNTGDSINSTVFRLLNEDYCTAISVLGNGNFLIAASTKTLGTSTDFFNPELIILDKDGNLLEANTINYNSQLVVNTIHENQDGSVFMIGSNTIGSNTQEAIIKLTNYNIYTTDWIRKISDNPNFLLSKSIILQDDKFVSVGTIESLTSSDIILAWLNNEGNLIKTKSIGGSVSNYGLGLDKTPDGGLIISGTSTFEGNASAVLIKLKKE